MKRAQVVKLLRLVMPYPSDWFDTKTTYELMQMFHSRKRHINAKLVQLSNERDDRETMARLRKQVGS